MTTTHASGRGRPDWGTLLAGLVALTALAAAVLLAISLAPASAETPAQRCKRETTAYNNAWKNSWAASHPGKKPSDAPKPPVPYKCGSSGQQPPISSTPDTGEEDQTTESDSTPESSGRDSSSGPSLNPPTSRKELEHPDGTSPTIKDGDDRKNKVSIVPFHSLLLPGQTIDQLRAEARALLFKVGQALRPIETYNNLVYRDKQLFLNANTLKNTVKVSSKASKVSRTCMLDGAKFAGVSNAGFTLYTYWHTIEKCGVSGTDVTARLIDRGGETSTPTWSYDGPAGEMLYKRPGLGTITIVITRETFSQSVVVKDVGMDATTACIRGVLDHWGNYEANVACSNQGG